MISSILLLSHSKLGFHLVEKYVSSSYHHALFPGKKWKKKKSTNLLSKETSWKFHIFFFLRPWSNISQMPTLVSREEGRMGNETFWQTMCPPKILEFLLLKKRKKIVKGEKKQSLLSMGINFPHLSLPLYKYASVSIKQNFQFSVSNESHILDKMVGKIN